VAAVSSPALRERLRPKEWIALIVSALGGLLIGVSAHAGGDGTGPSLHDDLLVLLFSEAAIVSSRELRERLRFERTNLLSKILDNWKDVPPTLLQQIDWRDSLYGYIGMEDHTLDPIIRPGSFVQIDSRQRTVPPVNWHDEHDRPIFFFELRDRYVCSWCELHGNQLILVPTPQSRGQARHIRYPGDATIVGRVTAVAMRVAEDTRRSNQNISPELTLQQQLPPGGESGAAVLPSLPRRTSGNLDCGSVGSGLSPSN
jgi:hypothetical protein